MRPLTRYACPLCPGTMFNTTAGLDRHRAGLHAGSVMTDRWLHDIINNVSASVGGTTWSWRTQDLPETGGWFLQLVYDETCVDTHEPKVQRGRKWYISRHATETEVVQTMLLACLVSAEHMVREHFHYQGARPYNPHIAVAEHIGVAGKSDARPTP